MTGNLIRVSNEKLLNFKENSSELENLVYSEEIYQVPWYLDLDKTWEAIHFLLSGKSIAEAEMDKAPKHHLDNVIFNSQLIDEEQDLGYGPASYNGPSQVQEISKKLNEIDLIELGKNYQGKLLNNAGVYPEIWEEEESKDYLFDNLRSLIVFYNEAADNQEAVIGFIN